MDTNAALDTGGGGQPGDTPQPNPNPPTWQVQVDSPQRYPSPPRVDSTDNTGPAFSTVGHTISHAQVLSTLGMQLPDGQNFHSLAPPVQPVFAVPGGYESRVDDYGTSLVQGSVAMSLPTTSSLQHLQQVLQQHQLTGDKKGLTAPLQVVPLFDPASTIQRVNVTPGMVSMATTSGTLTSIGGLGPLPPTLPTSTPVSQPLSNTLMAPALAERESLAQNAGVLAGDLQGASLQNHTIFPLMQTSFRSAEENPDAMIMTSTAETVQLNLSDVQRKHISDTFNAGESENAQNTESTVYSSVTQDAYSSSHMTMPQSLASLKLDTSVLQSNSAVENSTLAAMNSQPVIEASDRLLSGSHDTSGDLSANHMMTNDLQLIPPAPQSMLGMAVLPRSDTIGMVDESHNKEQHQIEQDADLSTSFGETDPSLLATRKSLRIAERERTPSPSQKAFYVPKEFYSTEEMWCEECQSSYDPECPRHPQTTVQDKIVLSRAWATLPSILQIFRLGNTPDLGVFARKTISKRTRFGPFFAPLVDNPDQVANKAFILKVEQENGSQYFLDPNDENACNWMMFVRPAGNFDEMNLVAYQYKNDIYFSATRNIDAKQELKVWYAVNYANRLGAHPLRPAESDMNAINSLNKWPCYECNKGFRTSALLQKHLSCHDNLGDEEEDGDEIEEGDEEEDGFEGRSRRGRRGRGANQGKVPKGKSKKIKELVGGDSTVFQSWKKRKTNMYLNKIKKYREPIKRSLMTLYKKQGKDSGGNEWVCTHCDLTFDNPSLLNLHTLTHAAEDLAMVDLNTTLAPPGVLGTAGDVADPSEIIFGVGGEPVVPTDIPPQVIQWDESHLQCPVCDKVFETKQQLILHASEHAKKVTPGRPVRFHPNKPFKCTTCWKGFQTDERLERHMECHSATVSKPYKCPSCDKSFMNASALACHEKTHSNRKYYECLICNEGFDQIHEMKQHVVTHCNAGIYDCPECHKSFTDYSMVRRHIRGFHSNRRYTCPDCGKEFPRHDKLKLHMLRHSNTRDFMCDICGRQFKRKDKLKEHTKRMHNPQRERKVAVPQTKVKKFTPKVEPSDFNRFIYKCHICLLGFKRRGMLVNHVAKRHPEMKADDIPELNLPILRTQRDYFCQYCEKVYKSSSKRKAHIQKYHPGCEVPPCARTKTMLNPSFSQPAGSVTTMPHSCPLCHKQYASKAKLLQHQRVKHEEYNTDRCKLNLQLPSAVDSALNQTIVDKPRLVLIQKQLEGSAQEVITIAPQSMQGLEALQGTDLLTQAMSELAEFRTHPSGTIEYQLTGNQPSLVQGTPTLQNSPTIDLAQLTTTSIPQPILQKAQGGPTLVQQGQGALSGAQVLSPGTIVMSTTQAAQDKLVLSAAVPITLGSSYLQKPGLNWNTATTFR